MTSKNISITEDVYNKLLKIKREDESFSELFLRLLKVQKNSLKKSFGAWDLSKEEEKEIWADIKTRTGRRWNKSKIIKMILLDTTAYIDFLNGNKEIKKVVEEQQ